MNAAGETTCKDCLSVVGYPRYGRAVEVVETDEPPFEPTTEEEMDR